MSLKVGIDVGGTFTDFLVTSDGEVPPTSMPTFRLIAGR